MADFTLQRTSQDDYATWGKLFDSSRKLLAFTCELPWRNNESRLSCISSGLYHAQLYNSPRHNGLLVPLLQDVPGRSEIEIHPANWPDQLLGCIALGQDIEEIEGKKGVTNSQATFKLFMARVSGPFTILIQDPPQ